MKRFAIGDIHGCHLTFRHLLEDHLQPTKEDEILLLGDLIDRGPDSKGVVDLALDLKAKGYKVEVFMGNHEEMLISGLKSPDWENHFLTFGGKETLESFGVTSVHQLPKLYLEFFKTMKLYREDEDYLFSHAGFNFENSGTIYSDIHAMKWIREMNPNPLFLRGRKVVHGHVPIPMEVAKSRVADPNQLTWDLDTGCVYTGRQGMGYLSAVELNSRKFYTVSNRESKRWF